MIRLFEDKIRVNAGPAAFNGDTYTAYNDSANPDMTSIREFISRWFDSYPEAEKANLKAAFKVKFHHAFFELFIFQLFTALGYRLTVHPDLPGTNKHPDFLAVKGAESFYLEAKCMDMQSQELQAKERRQNALIDALNKIDARNFLLMIRGIHFKDESQPNGNKITRFFNERLTSHDPEIYRIQLETTGFGGMPSVIYDDEHVKIEVKLMPKAEHQRGTASRAVGSLPASFQVGNDSEAIKEALETKATRYGRPDLPYIICLNKQAVSFDEEEVREALYGNREKDGFFGTGSNKKFTRVSGVYMTNANTANLASTAVHVFGSNAFAALPANFELTGSIETILNIPDNYHNRKLPGIF